jgi:hypothetical protein
MSESEQSDRHPLAPFVDLFVFAPIGAALTLRARLPELIDLGRTETENRLRLARMLGEFAYRYGQRELEKLLSPQPAQERSAEAAAPTPLRSVRPVAQDDTAAPPVDSLAVPGYDSLAASQVVARLASLSVDELELVREYESATRRRRTILNRIDQLAG